MTEASGPEEAAMQAYLRDGERRAAALGNRGPIRFTPAGELHPEIVEAYGRCGFYVFEGALRPEELADIERDLHDILSRLPVEKGASVDARAGRHSPSTAGDRPCSGPVRSATRGAAPRSPMAAIRSRCTNRSRRRTSPGKSCS